MADSKNSTLGLIEWLMRHYGHPLLHNVRGFCCGPCSGEGSGFLVDPEWNEAAEQVETDALSEPTLVAGLRERAERAERRCSELSREVGDCMSALRNTDQVLCLRIDELREARSTIDSLRANLADANARTGNDACEIERLKRLLGGHTCYPPMLSNPTREEAISALKKIQSIIGDDQTDVFAGACLRAIFSITRRVLGWE